MGKPNTTLSPPGTSMPRTRACPMRGPTACGLPLRTMPGAPSRTEGFVLIPVLAVLALVALVSALLSRSVTTDVKANANIIRRAEAEVMSDGLARLAIRYAVGKRIEGGAIGPFNLDGSPVSCTAGRFVASISVASTSGFVDLNSASRDTLERLFASAGAVNAPALAAAVTDFRDIDSDRSIDGAEAEEYAAAGLTHGPKNAPFTTVGELDQVLGMTPQIFARVRPYVTTRSGLATPDMGVAGRSVRAMSFANEIQDRPRTRYLRIMVSVHPAGATRQYTREAVIMLERRVAGGFLVKGWDRVTHHVAPVGAVLSDIGPCVAGLTPK